MRSPSFQYRLTQGILIVISLLPVMLICPNLMAATDLVEQLTIPGSPNPVGSGARALGMGGAFIAVADDATAASWNPGGLVQLEKPEFSIVGAWVSRRIDNSFEEFPEASGRSTASQTDLNYLSLSYPFYAFNKNMTISLNYQHLYDLNNQWHFETHLTDQASTTVNHVDNTIDGGLSALGIAYCIEIIPSLSLGMTVNIWQNSILNSNQWKWHYTQKTSGMNSLGQRIAAQVSGKDVYELSGINFNFGLLWYISSRWTLGAVLKTPFTADLKHDRYYAQSVVLDDQTLYDEKQSSTLDERLSMPMSYGIGLAYRVSDPLTISADIYRTEWAQYLHTDADGNEASPITGKPKNESDIDATHQIRLGVEYLFIKPNKWVIPLRGGLFYDPGPAKGSPDPYYGMSLGSGFAFKALIFDIAFQYRFGNDVNTSITTVDFSQDVHEYTIYSSLIIHF